MKKSCKECPYFNSNHNNDIVVGFAIKNKKNHNCHMIKGVKDFWIVDDIKNECYGSKNREKIS